MRDSHGFDHIVLNIALLCDHVRTRVRYPREARFAAHRVILAMMTRNADLLPLEDLAVAALAVLERGENSNAVPWRVLMRARLVVSALMMNSRLSPVPFVSTFDGMTQELYREMMRDRTGEEEPRPRRRRRRGRKRL